MKLSIPDNLKKELMFIVGSATGEISGLGEVTFHNNTVHLEKIHLIKQKCTSGSTDFDDEELAIFVGNHDNPEKLRLWWHSHGNMSVFMSSTDVDTEGNLGSDWFVSLVVNKKGEMIARISIVQKTLEDIRLTLDLDIETEEDGLPEWRKKELKEEIEKKVHHGLHTTTVGIQSFEDWEGCNFHSGVGGGWNKYSDMPVEAGDSKTSPMGPGHRGGTQSTKPDDEDDPFGDAEGKGGGKLSKRARKLLSRGKRGVF